jgi:hypothetical protein
MRGAFYTPEQEMSVAARGKGLAAEEEIKGRIRGIRGAFASKEGGTGTADLDDPETMRVLYGLGILKMPPAPTGEGQVLGKDVPPADRATIPNFSEGQFYRQRFDRLTSRMSYAPVSPISMTRGQAIQMANPERGGAPSWYYQYQDGTRKYLGDVSEKEQNIPVMHPDGSQEIVRLPPAFLQRPGGQAAPTTGAPPAPSVAPTSTPTANRVSAAAGPPLAQTGPATRTPRPAGAPTSGGGLRTKPPLRETVAKLEEKQGAIVDAQGNVAEKTALYDPNKGTYQDPQTHQPLPDFIPGKVGEGTVQMLAQTQATNGLIDRALAALEPLKGDNTLQGTLRFATKYRAGTSGGDPVAAAQSALSDLAGLQSSNSQALRGASRAYQYFVDKRQHVPILPSPRETQMTSLGVPSRVAAGVGQVVENAPSWDSPASMYQKLLLAKVNNSNFVKELKQGLGKTAPAGPPAPPPTGAPPSVSTSGPAKTVTQDEIAAIAKKNGTTPAQERQRATDAGYIIR